MKTCRIQHLLLFSKNHSSQLCTVMKEPTALSYYSHESENSSNEPRKKPFDFPLYWLFSRDP